MFYTGHNWGSSHDPVVCSPSDSDGGKYLMYTFAVTGLERNNMVCYFLLPLTVMQFANAYCKFDYV